MKINEIFKSIQGEGIHTGFPSVFIRLNGCNLRCAFSNGSLCDTPFSSWNPEKSKDYSPKELFETINPLLDKCNHIVITGGEPLLQLKELEEFLDTEASDYKITIETNGTIEPSTDLIYNVDLWSVSPKLENSCCFPEGTPTGIIEQHKKNMYNKDAIQKIIKFGAKYQLKFVYSNKDTESQIKKFLNSLGTSIKRLIHPNNILIMPEGTNEAEMAESAKGAIECCIKNGWRYCHRVHISVWGSLRGV